MVNGNVRIGVSSNIEEVIDSVDDVKDDIPKELEKRVGAAMRVLWADVKQYVLDDPQNLGRLFSSIKRDSTVTDDELMFSVYTERDYAGIVEYGSGIHTNETLAKGNQVPPGMGAEGFKVPGMPFETPDIETPPDDETMISVWNTHGRNPYKTFYGFAYHISMWMTTKGLAPHTGSTRVSALFIAKQIIEEGSYAHPFMRPAWFDNELKIRKAAFNAVRNAAR